MSNTANYNNQNTNSLINTKIKISNSTLNSVNKNQTNSKKDHRPISCKIIANQNTNPVKIKKDALQSAKINLSKSQPKLFSLVDIKDRYYSKGTSHPNQYRRKIYMNINKYLYNKDSQNLLNSEKFNTNNDLTFSFEKNEKDIKNLRKNLNQSALPLCKKDFINFDLYDKKEIKRDFYKPKGFEIYEKSIEEFNKNYIKNNYILSIKQNNNKSDLYNNSNNINNLESRKTNEAILIRKQNRINNLKSNIFFGVEDNKTNQVKKHNLCKSQSCKFTDSDIFNLKNVDQNIIQKSGEKSYFRELKYGKNPKIYDMNKETTKKWGLHKPLPSFVNHESTKYHLLNSEVKNICKTKEQIINDGKNISKDFNPIARKKGLCEFNDLCRVDAPNINEDYSKAFKQNPNVFKKQNMFNSEYYDIYSHYKNICDRPFKKFNPIY